jgi:hypothetical protein
MSKNDNFCPDDEEFDTSSCSINRPEDDDEHDELEQSINDAEEIAPNDPTINKKRKAYVEYCPFTNLEEILKKIKDGEIDGNKWTRGNTTLTNSGTKIWFTCRGNACNKTLVVEVNSVDIKNDDAVNLQGTVLIREGEHEHKVTAQKKHDISEATHNRIAELCFLGHKPERILQQLKSDGLDQPDKMFLNNLLKKFRKEKFGIKLPTYRELNSWCQEHSVIPEDDDDKVFVGSYEIESNLQKKYFRIFLTTKRLMSFTKYVSIFY